MSASRTGDVARVQRASLRVSCAWVAAGSLATLALAGCGLGAGPAPSAVKLTVTHEFGELAARSWSAPKVSGQETVMSLLMRNASVATRYAGGFVQSIDGVAGGHHNGAPVDWFYYVNGSEAPKGAAATNVYPGDHIWWDDHDWSQTDHIPAVVGSFPEPFLNGFAGKRLPVSVECAQVRARACRQVTGALRAAGAPAAVAALAASSGPHVLRVEVAPWSQLERDPVAGSIAHGPASSGVYARFASHGSTLALLDAGGRSVRTLAAGAGLIAATALEEGPPVWVVTGTDAAGVQGAASAFSESALRDHFAVAVYGGRPQALPVATP